MIIIIVIIIDHYIPFFGSISLQVFKIFFASGGKEALIPLIKINPADALAIEVTRL